MKEDELIEQIAERIYGGLDNLSPFDKEQRLIKPRLIAELFKAHYSYKWIPVSKRLPNDGETVLCYEPNCDEDIFTYRLGDDVECSITHWMPLPEPPKQ